MRLHLVAFGVLLVSSCTESANSPAKHDSAEVVQKVIIDTFDALSTGDTLSMTALCTADVMILENGAVWNMDSIITSIKAMPQGLQRKNSFEFIRTEVDGAKAWVAYKNKANVTLGEKRREITWLESATLKKENDQWKLELLHSTVLERKTLE